MLYDFSNALHREQAKAYFDKSIQAKEGVFEFKKKAQKRSLSQNAYLHVALGIYAIDRGETIDYVKDYIFKTKVNKAIFTAISKDGIHYIKSSSLLDTQEMTTAIERFRNFASVEGIYIPSPTEHDMIRLAEIEIKRYEQFL